MWCRSWKLQSMVLNCPVQIFANGRVLYVLNWGSLQYLYIYQNKFTSMTSDFFDNMSNLLVVSIGDNNPTQLKNVCMLSRLLWLLFLVCMLWTWQTINFKMVFKLIMIWVWLIVFVLRLMVNHVVHLLILCEDKCCSSGRISCWQCRRN